MTRSSLSGTARDVVQARDVHGGINFYASEPPSYLVPQQLPRDVSGFVDRVAELGQLAHSAEQPGSEVNQNTMVFVIAGSPGVGKTSLAVHLGHRVWERFPDGQLYINLRGYDPALPVAADQALERFLRALGRAPDEIPDDLEARAALYRSLVAGRRILIILDNASSVGQVRPLLPGAPNALVLITSRSRLSGLTSRDGARRITLGVLPEQEAAELLASGTAGYRFDDDPSEIADLARLCARLPLALRIAADRAASRPHMPLADLISELRDESALWEALSAESDEEPDAVRAVFSWSYRALPGEAARLFRLLGLHPSPEFGLPVAAAILGAPSGPTRRLLDALAGVHLVDQIARNRYQFHDLLWAYATDQVRQEETAHERAAVLRRMLSWYVCSADAAMGRILDRPERLPLGQPEAGVEPAEFPDRERALEWYEVEESNLVAASRTAADARLYRLAWQLPATIRQVYADHNAAGQWLVIGRQALDAARRDESQLGQVVLLESLGKAARKIGLTEQAIDHHRGAVDIRRSMGDRLGEARSVNGLGLAHLRARQLPEAREQFNRAVAIAAEIGDEYWSTLPLTNLGEVHFELGDLPEAAHCLERALAMQRDHGWQLDEATALRTLSATQRELGHHAEALTSAQTALDICRDLGNLVYEGWVLLELARAQNACGDADQALVSYHRAATLYRQLRDPSSEAAALDGAGETCRALGRSREAANFHSSAVGILRGVADPWRLAIALINLAEACQADAPDRATACRRESLDLLAVFTDPRAAQLRRSVAASLDR